MGRKSRMKKERRTTQGEMDIWHYTTDFHFGMILKHHCIIPTRRLMAEPMESNAVWLSVNPNWENMVEKRNPMGSKMSDSEPRGFETMGEYGLTPMRIKIKSSAVKIISWELFKKYSGISITGAKDLEIIAGIKKSDPNEWYVSYNPIGSEKWERVEFWDGAAWIPYAVYEEAAREVLGSI